MIERENTNHKERWWEVHSERSGRKGFVVLKARLCYLFTTEYKNTAPEVDSLNTCFRIAFQVNGAYVPTAQDYCNEYLAPRLSPSEISDCIKMVYCQVWCIYFEQDRDPAARALLHTDSLGRDFLVIEDYSLKVFLEISRLKQICILMDAVFV